MTAIALGGCAGPGAPVSKVELRIVERKGPTGRRITLVTDRSDPASITAWVYVHDPERNDGTPFIFGDGYGTDASNRMWDVVWSRDGSFVAIRTIADDADIQRLGSKGANFAAGYDFREHYSVTVRPDFQTQEAYSRLMKARGGTGVVQLTSPYDLAGEPMTPDHLRTFGDPRR